MDENIATPEIKTFNIRELSSCYAQKKQLSRPSCSCTKVLVADDNAMTQFTLKVQLQRLGTDVDIANHGEEAVQLVRESAARACCGPYRLVLLDISMPVMDGYEAAEAIRGLVGMGGTTIVGATGYAKKDIFRDAQRAGMDDVLTKPIEQDKLEELLSAHYLGSSH